jgi:nucleoside-diphosphate-sugar epimerase/glycosyltransferase involved in cell wall biosynthesis
MVSESDPELEARIRKLQGPILILGASGFVGANLFHSLLRVRPDVVGTASRMPAWRLEGADPKNVRIVDLLVDSNVEGLLKDVKPKVIFNCVAYGAYSFEVDAQLIYQTNFNFVSRLLERLAGRGLACYVHAGSSSEYGDKASAPKETDLTAPNSEYAVSKVAAANLLYFLGKRKKFPCCNLRLYSVYGPLEDSARLIPNVVKRGVEGAYPEFVDPNVSRDFVYVDDVTDAFVLAALNLTEQDYGESFNVGTGVKTTIGDVAETARRMFSLSAPPHFSMPQRHWDVSDWYADPAQAKLRLGWRPRVDFAEGMRRTLAWYAALPDKANYERLSKKYALDIKHSVSAVIACYKDNQAIEIMYDRLKATFMKLGIDYEIIFVNDCSPDDTEEVIRKITGLDRRVIGISHSRNFGSQAGFRSGMEVASKNSVVLLDGDLQDPPELIEEFVARWREGFDVVYGRRVKREASLFMRFAYKAFYRIFDRFSFVRIPHDAGDFSLMDRRVVTAMLRFPERDLFLRGVRAFAGFRQTGVDYVRPERMFGVTTNSLMKNIGWAKKGILAYSRVPLDVLSAVGAMMFGVTLVLMAVQVAARILAPSWVPPGITTLLLTVMFFGAINLFAVGMIGEYMAKVFEEVKRRPLFIRRSIIRNGDIRPAAMGAAAPED